MLLLFYYVKKWLDQSSHLNIKNSSKNCQIPEKLSGLNTSHFSLLKVKPQGCRKTDAQTAPRKGDEEAARS